jgi:uncharacterized protein YaaR (DUF327 family)
MTNVDKEVFFQMFEEIKESLAQIDKRMNRLEKQVFEDEEHSFRSVLEKNYVSMHYFYSELIKSYKQIVESLNEIKTTQNIKWWKRIFR